MAAPPWRAQAAQAANALARARRWRSTAIVYDEAATLATARDTLQMTVDNAHVYFTDSLDPRLANA